MVNQDNRWALVLAAGDAREHGISLRFESADELLTDQATGEQQVSESVLDAVHHALSGIAFALVDASELLVRVGPPHDHRVEVDASLRT